MANNQSATPKDFIRKTIEVAIQEVRVGMDRSTSIGKTEAHDSLAKDDLMIAKIYCNLPSTSFKHPSPLWVTATSTLSLTGKQSSKTGSVLSSLTSKPLTDNALAIVAAFSEILSHLISPLRTRRYYISRNSSTSTIETAGCGSNNVQPPPNAVVAKDGSGQYNTIAAALAAYPKNLKGRFIIYVKAGIYDEYITVTKDQVNILLMRRWTPKTIVTGQKCNRDGVSTYQSASFSTVDFIFGGAAAVLEALIVARKPMGNPAKYSDSSRKNQHSGDHRVSNEELPHCSRAITGIYFIQPAGWMPWSETLPLTHAIMPSMQMRGQGANTNNRVKWKGFKVITDRNQALQFTTAPFIQGTSGFEDQ
ncbi:hypothetical protein HAX54_006755 [Datura stramonium]|uniref:Pectinesterase catalytic domain-containing protein n=1 Tax=Datura stramonium TaxID=4076 RepID=A0ABS8TCF5_DATST|nr:hypothetical protein [Datura stramonium]